jgi:hypothetical protein
MKRLFGLFSLSIGIDVVYQFLKAFVWGGSVVMLDEDVSVAAFEWYTIFMLVVMVDALLRRVFGRRLKANIPSPTTPTWEAKESSAAIITRRGSFFDIAAWLSLITPPAVAITGLSVFGVLQSHSSLSDAYLWPLAIGLVWAASGTLAGVISLGGLSFHRRDSSLWIALTGIVVSAVTTVVVFFLFLMSCMGHNC